MKRLPTAISKCIRIGLRDKKYCLFYTLHGITYVFIGGTKKITKSNEDDKNTTRII
jgi:hypothetical protein